MLLRTLVYWSLSTSQAIQVILKESYKQARQEDDRNQPLSVQPWGRDGYKRRYWLIEGQDDTHFELYRENNGFTSKTNVWFGVAGTIEELQVLATKLDEEGTPHARSLRDKIHAAIPRFEAGEEKRRRRDYRLARKAAFARPEPGFSLYEGRTRGKRMRYTFSDDEDDFSDNFESRRSTRQSGISTPAETGPVVTASGRQVKPRHPGMYGESMLTDQRKELDDDAAVAMEMDGDASNEEAATTATGRPQRSNAARTNGLRRGRNPAAESNAVDEMEDESDAVSDEHDWEAEDEDEPDFEGDDEVEESEESEGDVEEDDEALPNDSLVVQLRYRGGSKGPEPSPDQSKTFLGAGNDAPSVVEQSRSDPRGEPEKEVMNDAIKVERRPQASNYYPTQVNGVGVMNGTTEGSGATNGTINPQPDLVAPPVKMNDDGYLDPSDTKHTQAAPGIII